MDITPMSNPHLITIAIHDTRLAHDQVRSVLDAALRAIGGALVLDDSELSVDVTDLDWTNDESPVRSASAPQLMTLPLTLQKTAELIQQRQECHAEKPGYLRVLTTIDQSDVLPDGENLLDDIYDVVHEHCFAHGVPYDAEIQIHGILGHRFLLSYSTNILLGRSCWAEKA